MKKNKKLLALILSIVVMLSGIPVLSMQASAASTTTLAELQAKYPAGKYWNGGNANSYTSSPCTHHGHCSYNGSCGCNTYKGLAIQCMGFAYQLASLVYGGNPYSDWHANRNVSALNSLKAGDVVRYKNNGHSIFVTAVNGETVTYADCNSDGHCVIRWNQTISKATLRSTFSYVDPAPYAWNPGNGTHTHSYSSTYYEAAHPHRVYEKCSCGATRYTGATKFVSTCSSCMTKDSRYPTPFKAYNLANAKTEAFDTVSGTRVGYIYGSDECTIQEVYTNGWCKVLCPWTGYSNGRTVYAKLSTFLNTNYTPASVTVSTQTTTYTRSNASTNYGYIGAGDKVTKVGSSGSYTQVIYPLTAGGYKCAWAVLPANVSSDNSYPVPFKCRIISTTKVKCYNDVNFTSSPGYIYPEDDCVITAIYSNGKVQCKCPWNDGSTKTVYVNKSVFINSSTTPQKTTAPKYAKTYLRTDMSKNIGWIDKGDAITIVATSGNKTQIIYPADVGQRCAWVYTSDLQQTYTVSYDANGGTGAPPNQTKTHGVNLTLSDKCPTRDGYTFLGWATSPSASTATYTAGGGYSGNANLKLYAVWKANEYNISFDANGGDGAPSPQTKTHGKDLTLSSTSPKRTGYTFMGWATTSSASSAAYQPGQKFTMNASTTLYAVWKAKTYTISFDAKGGLNAPKNQTKTYDVNLLLSNDEPTREGYTFLGWSTSSEAVHVNYHPGDRFELNDDVTLYAVWEKNAVTVTKIEIVSQPGKTVYQIGDSLNTAGLSIKVTYSDNSTKTITSGFTVDGFESNTAGVKTVTVSYENQMTSFKVTVKAAEIDENEPQIIVEKKTAKAGQTVQVAVTLKNNPGIWGMDLVVNYDKTQLTLSNVTNGSVFSSTEWTQGKLSSDRYILSYEAGGFDNITADGVLATLEFTVNETATTDTLSAITVSYNAGDIINVDFDEIKPTVVSGGVMISDIVYGDLNGDGLVNKKDSLLMKMYLADNSTVIDKQAADVYADGTINKKDSLYLKQYLAGLDIELG